MRTPKEYTDNLKKGIATFAMVQDVLYSYSKRAKNYRDRIREIRNKARWNRYWYDKYDDEGKCEQKRDEYYMKKSDLLKHCPEKLKAIHRLTIYHKHRVYDYDGSEWDNLEGERQKYLHHQNSKVVWMNSYYDHDTDMEVEFCDVRVKQYQYFLYYEFDDRSFHSPIELPEVKNYQGLYHLEIKDLDELTTYGEDVNELLSVQFCDKVWTQVTGKGNEAVEELVAKRKHEDEVLQAMAQEELCKELDRQLDADPQLKAELEGKTK